MPEDPRSEVTADTRAEEAREESQVAGADREPTAKEEELAEQAADELEQSGELADAGEHEKEMNRLGAEVKGEGSIS